MGSSQMGGSSLLKKITRQISPLHNPEGITFGRHKPIPPKQAVDPYVAGLVAKLAQYDVEHVEQSAVQEIPQNQKQNEKQKQKQTQKSVPEPPKQRSKARLTGARVAELVDAAVTESEGMYIV
ncbi:uncharacterized protein LALA0_S04e02300g [Lachancea lanzarotensis]|uniref:LALA0S04e02300g1_1 n=1 Tax=Lachancea lanzarotensis TaxID=1245769 RepID=A0A0C7N5I5_9SACH|nr:uncharacterized protein LALA0_S04e02300g [Lachancea lanzarotensis]CEP61858.1 LALA0S04e02300g1_1 [Lachancea lanzarotensis]